MGDPDEILQIFCLYKSYKRILKRVLENKSEARELDVAMVPVSASEQKELDLNITKD